MIGSKTPYSGAFLTVDFSSGDLDKFWYMISKYYNFHRKKIV